MTRQGAGRPFVLACALVAIGGGVAAQDGGRGGVRSGQPGAVRQVERAVALGAVPDGTDPLGGPVVQRAPYTADVVTTVTQVLGDGTRIEQSAKARFYRDSAGRVRREQTIIGLGDVLQTTITIDPDPGDPFVYVLDADARTARRISIASGLVFTRTALNGVTSGFFIEAQPSGASALRIAGGNLTAVRAAPGLRLAGLPAPDGIRPVEESLGTRQIEGLKAVGRKTTMTIPTGQIGNDRPIEITDEKWESPELKLLVLSRFHDPRTGDVEYQFTNIIRAEPPPDLFQVPPDYTVVGAGQGAGARGGRGRGTPGGVAR